MHTEAAQLSEEASAERQQRRLVQEARALGVHVYAFLKLRRFPLIWGPFAGSVK